MGIFSNFGIFFNAHDQIWSCHMTQDVNFEILFCPNSTFNIKNSHKISGEKALHFRSYQPKTSRGVKNNPLPSAFRVKEL